MTHAEIKTLGHAFFDGKVLQYRTIYGGWTNWTSLQVPNLFEGDWRIKPAEPKKIKFIATVTNDGFLRMVREGSVAHENAVKGRLMLIPALNYEVILSEESSK